MSQHDPSAPDRRYFPSRPAGAHPRGAHGEPGSWPPEVPEPASVPTDWSPSGAYRGHHPSGRTGEPGAASAAWLPGPTMPGGVPASWEQASGFTPRSDPGSTPAWAGPQPETGPVVSWNGDTTISGSGYRGSHADPEPAAWSGSPVPDRIPAEWHDGPFPDSVPPSWNTDPPAASWNAPSTAWNAAPVEPSASWNRSAAEPSAASWNRSAAEPAVASWNGPSATTGNAAPGATPVTDWQAKVDLVVASARTEGKVANPDRTAGRARRSPRLRMAVALAAAALAGGGVGAGLMAAFGGDSAVTVPADSGIGQAPAGQAPTGEPPTAQPSKGST
ncbi:hypothetical protein [Actinoplanes xinjiangensis]|uniref:hypothetical protein n=1 Tax=Actinoplanes xinjiangensis TaxID=512350 RepID=UPI003441115A